MRTTLRVLIPSLLLLTWTFAVQAAQPLRVGLSGNYLPLHGIEGGRLVGLEVDLARALGEQLGREVSFVNPKAFSMSSLSALRAGKVDISLNSVTITAARAETVSFTRPYVTLRYRLAAPPGTSISSLGALTGRVALPSGPTLEAARAAMPKATLLEAGSPHEAVGMLLRGEADYVCNEDVGLLLSIGDTDLVLAGPAFGESPLGIAAPLGQADPFDHALAAIEPQLRGLIDKWSPGVQKAQAKENLVTVKDSFNRVISPDNESLLYSDVLTIKGETSADCSKITVQARNPDQGISTDYTLSKYKLGQTAYAYNVRKDYGNIAVGHNYYSFTAHCGGRNLVSEIVLYFHEDEAGEIDMAEVGKPVVYLYPQQELQVRVAPRPEHGVTYVEPELLEDGSWQVLAHPDGSILDPRDGQLWPYLFWEGNARFDPPEAGFVVARQDLEPFFAHKLALLGLAPQEIEDFLGFWIPALQGAPYHLFSFLPLQLLERHMPLDVEPAPDTLIRVYFDHLPLPAALVFPEQQLQPGPERVGFTVVEWGGRLDRARP